MELLIVALIVSIIGPNVFSTIVIMRSDEYELRQKILQFLFIWAVPILGALMSWYLARELVVSRMTTNLTGSYAPDDGHLRQGNYSEGDHGGAGDGGDA